MLSLAKLGRGREDYHLRSVGADATIYYSERGEVAGLWLGGGATSLGLEGRVQDEQMLAVLAGYQPGARRQPDGSWLGVRLVAPPSAGKRMPGMDACFKAPKSVSLLWAFGDRIHVGGSRALDRVIEQAHDGAVREALGYLESQAARGRRGKNGLVQVETTGFVAAAFRHRTSRANDPHLHTHVLIANMGLGSDGRWGALDARLLYAHAKTAGYLYESHLRHRLTAELGLDWTAVEKGIADVAGVPEAMIELFSQRSRELRRHVEEVTRRINEERTRLGLPPIDAGSAEAMNIAAVQTRAAKLHHQATPDLRADWRERALTAGHDPDRLAEVLHRVAVGADDAGRGPELYRRVGERLTEHASTFGQREVLQALADEARLGAPLSEVLERASAMLGSPEVVPVIGAVRDQDLIRLADGAVAPVPTGERRWSTPEMLAVEERLVAGALGRLADGTAVVPDAILRESLSRSLRNLPSLGVDQLEMAVQLATSGAGVECVEAAPGTGKTTALGVYAAACRLAGIPLVGCAPTARGRDELRLGAQIDPCYTVDALLLTLHRSALAPHTALVLDEASMCGSRKLGRLLEAAGASSTKVVLVGDTRQLSAVDAGGGFRGLVARLGAHRLVENRRQVELWEREALRHMREGQVGPAMAAYAAHGRLHLGEREELLAHMVGDWWAARAHGEAVMQAGTWRDVLELNRQARERLVEAGQVEPAGVDVRGLTVGVGDQVIVLRNERRLGVINGTLGTVTAIDRRSHDLVLRTTEVEPRAVRLPASFYAAKGRRQLALAYCRTIHKAQGATYRGASFTLAGDDTISLEATHVALSRGTDANHLYYHGEPPADEDQREIAEMEAVQVERLVAAVGRSRAQVMALDLLQRMAPRTDPTDDEAEGSAARERLRQRRLAWARRPATSSAAANEAAHVAAIAARANRGQSRGP